MSSSKSNPTLVALNRKVRKLKTDVKTISVSSTETASAVGSQKNAITRLERENELLRQELILESRQTKQVISKPNADKIKMLQDDGDLYTRKIEQEKKRIQKLDEKLASFHQKILDQKQKMGGVSASRDNNNMIARQVRILENRMDKALIKYNETLGKNRVLRNHIDEIRRERVVFDGIYKKIETELHDKMAALNSLKKEAEIAFNRRDIALKEMEALKKAATFEQENFEKEWKSFDLSSEANEKIKDYVENQLKSTQGNLSVEQEEGLKKQIARGAWQIGKDKVQMLLSKEKVISYEEAFSKIQEATGIHDIDELVNTFIESEDKNYSLYTYVNTLADDIEKMEAQVMTVKAEIDKYKGQGINSDHQKKRILKDLEDQLNRTKAKGDAYEKKYEESLSIINQLVAGIQSVFHKIGCNNSAAAELLGNQGVTKMNMMQYLGVIEQRTNELFQLYSASVSKPMLETSYGDDKQDASHHTPNSHTLKVAPPGVDDLDVQGSDEDDDDDARPLSLDEVERSVMRRIQYKATKGSNKRAAREKREREKGHSPNSRIKKKGEII